MSFLKLNLTKKAELMLYWDFGLNLSNFSLTKKAGNLGLTLNFEVFLAGFRGLLADKLRLYIKGKANGLWHEDGNKLTKILMGLFEGERF